MTTADGRMKAVFPPGALEGAATVTLEPIRLSSPAKTAQQHENLLVSLLRWLMGIRTRLAETFLPAEPEGSAYGSAVFNLIVKSESGSSITTFAKPVTLSVKFKQEDVTKASGDPANVKLLLYSSAKGWEDLGSTVDATAFTVSPDIWKAGLFAGVAEFPKLSLSAPPDGYISFDLAPLLVWTPPESATQYHIQLVPFKNDGPGINLIRDTEASYQVRAPEMSGRNYVILPGMTYTWRIRTTTQNRAMGEDDSVWS